MSEIFTVTGDGVPRWIVRAADTSAAVRTAEGLVRAFGELSSRCGRLDAREPTSGERYAWAVWLSDFGPGSDVRPALMPIPSAGAVS